MNFLLRSLNLCIVPSSISQVEPSTLTMIVTKVKIGRRLVDSENCFDCLDVVGICSDAPC